MYHWNQKNQTANTPQVGQVVIIKDKIYLGACGSWAELKY